MIFPGPGSVCDANLSAKNKSTPTSWLIVVREPRISDWSSLPWSGMRGFLVFGSILV